MNASRDIVTSTGMSRREAIRRAALVAGVAAFAPAWLSLVNGERVSAQAGALSAEQLALVAAIADRILPRTDTPGASDVGVPAFIDRLYSGFMTDAERQMLSAGLAGVQAASAAAHRNSFSALTVAQQDDLLRGIARAEDGQPQGFFRVFRSATILGYFTSEVVGKNVLHYDPIPGRYDGCLPISDVGNRNWTT
jgi:hypothetical protein